MSNARARVGGCPLVSRWGLLFFGVAAFLSLAGCVKPVQLSVPLVERPTDRLNLGAFAGALPLDGSVRVAVAPVVDARADKAAIGVNAEDPVRIPVHASGREPATFVQESVAHWMTEAGLHVVPVDASPTRVLKIELLRFWVEETERYRAEVKVKVVLTNAAGATVWEGLVNGGNTRFGRSLSAENYQEGLSDATVQVTQSLLANAGFQKALR